jgi:hypothetical protein
MTDCQGREEVIPTNASRVTILVMVAAAALAALAGCKSYAQAGQYTVTIDAPAVVHRGEKFYFTATLKDAQGNTAGHTAYQYKLLWEGIEGIFHKGKSGVEQRINVKGAPGTATVIIYGEDAQGNLTEIGKKEFQVE